MVNPHWTSEMDQPYLFLFLFIRWFDVFLECTEVLKREMMEENNIVDHQQLYFPQWSTIFLLSAHSVIFVSGFLTNWFVTRYVERRKDAMKLFRRLALAQFKVGHLVNASRLILMFRLLVEFQQIGNIHLHLHFFKLFRIRNVSQVLKYIDFCISITNNKKRLKILYLNKQ